MRTFIRANFKIRVPKVRLVNADGSMAGILNTRDALKIAQDQGQDLVEIAPNADPPVCRIMDFGKFKYQESLKEKAARKNSHSLVLKEMKFHSNVGDHDFNVKVNHTKDFITAGHKVKISLTFRGRENVHRDLGFVVINRLLKECEPVCIVEMPPRMMGHSIVALLSPRRGSSGGQDEVSRPAPPAKKPAEAPRQPVAPTPVPVAEPVLEPVVSEPVPEELISEPVAPVVESAPTADPDPVPENPAP